MIVILKESEGQYMAFNENAKEVLRCGGIRKESLDIIAPRLVRNGYKIAIIPENVLTL